MSHRIHGVLRVTTTGLLVAALMRWLARVQTERPAFTATGGVLRHGSTLFMLGAVCTLFFVGCADFSYFSRTGGPKVAALVTGFALLGLYLLIEYFVAGTNCGPTVCKQAIRRTAGGQDVSRSGAAWPSRAGRSP